MSGRFILIALLLALSLARPALAAPACEGYEVKRMTFVGNAGNFARETWDKQRLTLSVGIGTQADVGFGILGARLKVPGQLTLVAKTGGTFTLIDQNSFTGVIVDYHTPSGYLKRVAWRLGPSAPARSDYVPGWGKSSPADATLEPQKLDDGRLTLDLQAQAPIGWDGLIWLAALVENTGKGTTLDVTLEGVEPKLGQDVPNRAAETAIKPIAWQKVALKGRTLAYAGLDGAGQIALEKLTARTKGVMPAVPVSAELKPGRKSPLLLVGTVDALAPLLGAAEADALRVRLADEKPWRREQGYVIQYDRTRDLLLAVAGGRLGVVYALAHLERTVLDQPRPAFALESGDSLEKPNLEERGIYINIGFGISMGRASVDNWNEADWERFIDQIILARATFWSYFMWTDGEHIFPDTTNANVEKNKHVHAMLRHATAYSQKRGLRAVRLFAPTLIAAEMVERHPAWAAKLEYPSPGIICTRNEDAYAMSKIFQRHEMEYFQGLNETDISFYDPGGCMCETCRKGDVQLGQLLKLVRDYDQMNMAINPGARFGFWTWGVWRYERMHNYSIRGKLFEELARQFKGRERQVVAIDSLHGDAGTEPLFKEAKQYGFRTSNFIYQTNIEDGNGLLLPLLEFSRGWASKAQAQGLDESFLMIMEVGAKYPMAHFGAEFFWDGALTADRVTGRYSLQLAGNEKAAEWLQRGFLGLERLTYQGAIGVENYEQEAARMRECFEKGVALTAPERRAQIAWLVTMARSHELLFKAVTPRQRGDSATLATLKQQLKELDRQDPLYTVFADVYVDKLFDPLVGWLSNGFKNNYF